jgi:hypothetical protein
VRWLKRLGSKRAALWAAEVAGVALVALAAASAWLPAAALVAGVYLVLVANAGGE